MYIGIHAYGRMPIQEAAHHQLGNLIWIPKWGYPLGTPAGYVYPDGGWPENTTSGYSPDVATNPALAQSLLDSVRYAVEQGQYFIISGRRGLCDQPLHGGFGYGGDSSGDFIPPDLLKQIEEAAGPLFLGVHLEELDSDYIQNSLSEKYYARWPDLYEFETRRQAREKFENWLGELVGRYENWGTKALLNTTLTYHHYAFRAGCQFVLAEVLEHLTSVPVQYAYLRGASKQYDKPWGIWVSPWYWGRVPTDDKDLWPAHYATLDGGHSVAAFQACLFAAWFSGATLFTHQETEAIFVRGQEKDHWELGSWGKALKDFASFAKQVGEPGKPKIDTALLLDLDNGWCPAGAYQNWDLLEQGQSKDKIWGLLPMSPEDESIPAVMNLFYPDYHRSGTLELRTREDEYPGYFTRTPLGQCDVVLSDSTADNLSDYRTIIAVGSFSIDDRLASTLSDYVENGGSLLMSAEQLRNAPDSLRKVFGVAGISEPDQMGHIVEMNEQSLLPLINDGTQTDQRRFIGHQHRFNRISLDQAVSLANCGDYPFACAHRYGKGLAVTTALFSLVEGRPGERLVRFERELISRLVNQNTNTKQRTSGDISWMLNLTERGLMLMVVNHAAHNWCGTIDVEGLYGEALVVWQTGNGNTVSAQVRNGSSSVHCSVSAHGVLIAALQ